LFGKCIFLNRFFSCHGNPGSLIIYKINSLQLYQLQRIRYFVHAKGLF